MWITISIFAYFILAIVSLIDKHLLVQKIPSPKVYVFYTGILSSFTFFLILFVDFSVPGPLQLIISLLAGIFFFFGLFWYFKGLNLFEASRIVPAVGGFTPLFIFGLTYIFSLGKETLEIQHFAALLFLVLGSFLITYEKKKKVTMHSLKVASLAALGLALYFVLTKYVYEAQPFWQGFIWIRVGQALTAVLFFLIYKEVRDNVFAVKQTLPKKTASLFLFNQGLGGSFVILQNWAIALAPVAYVAVVSALQGTQYVFLILLAIFVSLKLPWIIKEEVSKEVLLQKAASIFLIVVGLTALLL